MRIFARLLGLLFIVAALVVLGADLTAASEVGQFELRPLGALWYGLHPGSLNLTQAVIERYIWAPIWDPVLITVLQWPAAVVFGVLGLVLFALGFLPRRAAGEDHKATDTSDERDTAPPPAA
jgi:hypothetical protein